MRRTVLAIVGAGAASLAVWAEGPLTRGPLCAQEEATPKSKRAKPWPADSHLVIEEAVTLLEAKKGQLELLEDKRTVDSAIAALRSVINPQRQPDEEPDRAVVISPAKLRARFGGRAAFNPKERTLSLIYTLGARNEFKDFDAGGSAMRVRDGFLRLDPGDDVKHVVRWKSVTMTSDIEVAQLRGPAVSTGEGFAFVGAGVFADWIQFRLPGGEKGDIQVEGALQKGRFPLRLELTPTRAMASYGGAKVGKAWNVQSVGQISLRGGDAGYGFARITLSGEPDSDWLQAFMAGNDGK